MWKTLVMRSLKSLNVLITTLLFALGWNLFYAPELGRLQFAEYIAVVALLYLVAVIMLNRIYNAMMVGSYRVSQLIYSQTLTAILLAALAYLVVVIINLHFENPLPLLCVLVGQIIWSILWTVFANKLYFVLNQPKKTAIVYCHEEELRKFNEIKHFNRKFQVVKYVEGAEVIFLADLNMDVRNAVVKHCIKNNMQCYILPHVGDVITAGAEHMQMFSVPIMRIQKSNPHIEYLLLKRMFDIFAACMGILVTSPFMLITAIAIKLYDGGPALYKQVRLTKDGKEFKILKFRSMRTDAEKNGAQLSTKNDDRITPVGKIIRKIRFDELPQLFNILKGDMTIVGPRPERPEIAAQYEEEIPSFGLRLQVKAGLTGYAQIYGRYNTEPYDKLKMDLMYINNMSAIEDLRLMLATVKVLFLPESTEGIEESQVTALHKETAEEKELQNI